MLCVYVRESVFFLCKCGVGVGGGVVGGSCNGRSVYGRSVE